MSSLLNELNEMQRKAVETTEGPLLVLAGAGSGKTRVLTYRIAYLIEECGVAPWNILAITFTNKAAKEMGERLEKLIGEAQNDMWVKTFHSMCVRILRKDILYLGYDRSFTIYDTDDQKTLIKDCLKELAISDKMYPPRSVMSVISDAKNNLITPQKFADMYETDYRMKGYSAIYSLYQKKLQNNNAVDFDDLISLTVTLFEEFPEVLEYYQRKFRYILVDEYQDTNGAQYTLVKLLSQKHRNLCVVGDDDQSIYKFRGADIRNILEFEKDFPDAKTIKLEQNYRSTQTILDAANGVIANNVGRKGKKLWTGNGEGAPIVLYEAQNEYDEAQFIATRAKSLTSEGFRYSDMVVLFRTNAQSRVLEERLLNEAVPYRLLSGIRFYDRKEIKDLIAYLKLLLNPNDDVSLKRVINEPKRGIGKTTVEHLTTLSSRENMGILTYVKTHDLGETIGRGAGKIGEFISVIDELTALAENTERMADLVHAVLQKTGYIAALTVDPNDVENRSRVENLQEFVSMAADYDDTADEGSFADFMDSVSLISDIDNYDEDQETVTLMTMHTAKGLEFPVVFLCGAEEGLFPSYRSIDEGELEEERRICYVAITRAMKKLYVSHARKRTVFGSTTYPTISRFAEEIPEELLRKEFHRSIENERRSSLTNHLSVKPNNYTPNLAGFSERLSQSTTQTPSFSVGDLVLHKKFGRGMVLSVTPMGNDLHMEIAFDTVGTKKLLALYAKLTKLED